MFLPEHEGRVLQAPNEISDPVQSAPPPEGGGLVQYLLWVLCPLAPQVTEQAPQGVHSVQSPCTGKMTT